MSPCVRQVAHALLTRPPLTLPSIGQALFSVKSVRLACVKHAASVHPEPGSNSLVEIDPDSVIADLIRFLLVCFGRFHDLC